MRLQDEVSYLYSPMRRNQSEMGSQGLIELSTISYGCTATKYYHMRYG